MHAIDKRIFLDGVISHSGSWDKSWDDTESFTDELLNHELIGFNNGVCGDSSNGWSPALPENNNIALVNCNLINPNKVPMRFSLSAERKGVPTDSTIINSWGVRLFHENIEDFNKYYYLYPEIVKGVKIRNALQMTGSMKARYINWVTGNETTAKQCHQYGTDCALEFLYETSHSPLNSQDVYLRVDGSNAMRNSLVFSVNATQPSSCKQQTWDGASYVLENIPCGLNYDPVDESLDVTAHRLFASGLTLVDNHSATPAAIQCKDLLGQNTSCGFALVSTISTPSVRARAYVNSMIASDRMSVRRLSDGMEVFDVNENGELFALGTIWTKDDLRVWGDIHSDGDITTFGELTAEGDVIAKERVIALDGVESRGEVLGQTLYIEEHVDFVDGSFIVDDETTKLDSDSTEITNPIFTDGKFEIQSSNEGERCQFRMLGGSVVLGYQFSGTNNPTLLSCNKSTKRWEALVSGEPVGTIAMWAGSTAPAGWLEMNGQSTAAYPTLKSIVGSYLPDTRGYFVRGWNSNNPSNPDKNRSLRSYQGDAIRNIEGSMLKLSETWANGGGTATGAFEKIGGYRASKTPSSTDSSNTGGVKFDASRVVPTADENRPKNIALMYIIKHD